jgi:mRNA-degrading endonuclease RelE of RelBE toxin-antitoxin system
MKHAPRELQGLSKIRVGEWRVLLWLDEKSKTITLYRVGHRKEIYQNL